MSILAELSVCMIVKDEIRSLERCLRSVKEVADEVVVVDTGSTDGTRKLARELGARVHTFKWNDSFADARNFAVDKAKGSWILQLDADEVLHEQDQDLVRQAIEEAEIDAFKCQIVNLRSPDSFEGAVIHGYPRLFRRGTHRYEGIIHEQLVRTSGSGAVAWSDIHIVHGGYLSADPSRPKSKRNLRMLQKAAEENPDNALIQFYLGKEFASMGGREAAIEHFDKAETLKGSGGVAFLSSVAINKAETLWSLGRLDEAAEYIGESCLRFYDYRDVHYLAAKIYMAQNEWQKALDALENTRSLPDPPQEYAHALAGIDQLAVQGIGLCLWNLERYDEACSAFREYLRIRPGDGMSFHYLATHMSKDKTPTEVLEELQGLVDLDSDEIKQAWADLTTTKSIPGT